MNKNLMRLRSLIAKAKHSSWYLFLLNRAMWIGIPFNKPHRFLITSIANNSVKVTAKRKRKNLNHLGGIHACAIATIGEYASGILLISHLEPDKYRIIMAQMEIEYHYQAKKDIFATASLEDGEKESSIIEPLREKEAIFITMEVPIRDLEDQSIATVKVKWQIKSWKSVRTK